MNKQELYDYFDGQISKTCIHIADDGEAVVRGKYATIAVEEDGNIDVWICNNKDLPKGLGQKAVNNRVQAIPECRKWRILDVEAWGKVTDKGVIQRNLKLLGIRKKMVVSESHRQKFIEMRKNQ